MASQILPQVLRDWARSAATRQSRNSTVVVILCSSHFTVIIATREEASTCSMKLYVSRKWRERQVRLSSNHSRMFCLCKVLTCSYINTMSIYDYSIYRLNLNYYLLTLPTVFFKPGKYNILCTTIVTYTIKPGSCSSSWWRSHNSLSTTVCGPPVVLNASSEVRYLNYPESTTTYTKYDEFCLSIIFIDIL